MTGRERFPGVRVHPTAIIEDEVEIGEGSSVWDNAHIRRGARLGKKCIIGEKTYVAYEVQIGSLVKLNAGVYVCAGVTIEDGVMISAHTVFTNDKFPRAALPDFSDLITSDPTEETLRTIVRRGVTIGANATIGPGIELGEFSMVGMGSVVTKSVPAHALVFGSPAQVRGYVCVCGNPLDEKGDGIAKEESQCSLCRAAYRIIEGAFTRLSC